jgi:DNA-binding MarR family transcriptional regulator
LEIHHFVKVLHLARQEELGNLGDMLGVELRIAQILADRVFGQVNTPKMPPGHFTVLSLIRLNPGINQSALARCMYLDRSTMVPILDQFEKKGWLERRPKANDRRAYALFLTHSGEKALAVVEKRVAELEDRISATIGKRKRRQLMALIKELQEALWTIDEAH